jgi:thiamine-phosphate pyrophosphorylase
VKRVVISPDVFDPREPAVLAGLFAAGLERYHVRKPAASAADLEAWLRALPEAWRPRLVLHSHHELVAKLNLGGRHDRASAIEGLGDAAPGVFTSRSCHDLTQVRAALGVYDGIFVSPIFPSVSKPGYGPTGALPEAELRAVLTVRTPAQRCTEVIALGGINPANAARCRELGFDGVAVLGALWQAADPLAVFRDLQVALGLSAASANSSIHAA